MKRVLVLSDFHCGHITGLTPPSWHDTPPATASQARKDAAKTREALYSLFEAEVEKIKPIDVLIVNGDCIDGRQERQGGLELIVSDRDDQAAMAAEIIRRIMAKSVVVTYGTPYHTGKVEDYERQVVKDIGNGTYEPERDIKGHAYVDVDGVVFSVKHKVGSSQIPHGRHTATARENMWNAMWAERGTVPRADVLIRSHVHYFQYGGDARHLYMTTPGLQGLGSKYGSRQCSGTVDWGFVYFDIESADQWSWNAVVPREAELLQKVHIIKA